MIDEKHKAYYLHSIYTYKRGECHYRVGNWPLNFGMLDYWILEQIDFYEHFWRFSSHCVYGAVPFAPVLLPTCQKGSSSNASKGRRVVVSEQNGCFPFETISAPQMLLRSCFCRPYSVSISEFTFQYQYNQLDLVRKIISPYSKNIQTHH